MKPLNQLTTAELDHELQEARNEHATLAQSLSELRAGHKSCVLALLLAWMAVTIIHPPASRAFGAGGLVIYILLLVLRGCVACRVAGLESRIADVYARLASL